MAHEPSIDLGQSQSLMAKYGSSSIFLSISADDIFYEANRSGYSAQAVRDWNLMVDCAAVAGGRRLEDPFRLSSEWELTSAAMKEAGLLKKYGKYESATLEQKIGLFAQRNRIIRDHGVRPLFGRFMTALFGGVALVGPMLLMVLHNDQTTTLSVVSVAFFLFAAVVAFYFTDPKEIIVSAVAAYAAVLVVFVGANH